jgi:hypothetical protein
MSSLNNITRVSGAVVESPIGAIAKNFAGDERQLQP